MHYRRTFFYIIELAAVSVNFLFVYFLVDRFDFFYPFDLFPAKQVVQSPVSFREYMPAYWAAITVWALILWIRGGYRELRVQSAATIIQRLVFNGILFFGFFASAAFIFKMAFLSRFFMFLYSVSSTLLLAAIRLSLLSVARRAWRQGQHVRNVILAGTGRRAQQFMSHVAKHPEWGYRIVGLIDKETYLKGETIAGYKVIGGLEDLPTLLETRVVDEVVFVTPRSWLDHISKCILYCEAVGVPATLATDLFDLEIASGTPKKMEGIPYLTFQTPILRGSELFLKRTFDVVASASILALASPLLLTVAFLIKATSPGPVFFRQMRSGLNGRRFYLYKFRSMVVDAEARLAELKDKNEMSGPVFKMSNDPRVTKIGHFLRATSLDEFPQFWNVLKGDMSVVGPRPPLPSEVEKYVPWQRRRLSMKPGITCIWQVSGRNNIDFEQWMGMDLQYIDNWSLWLDLKLLFLTVRAVFARTGK